VAENRRDFLKRAGGTAALGLPALGGASAAAQPGWEERVAARRRPRWPPSGLFLELAGQPAGPVGSDSSGGYAFAEVVTERPGPDRIAKSLPGNA
jgi:hypothetical protein